MSSYKVTLLARRGQLAYVGRASTRRQAYENAINKMPEDLENRAVLEDTFALGFVIAEDKFINTKTKFTGRYDGFGVVVIIDIER